VLRPLILALVCSGCGPDAPRDTGVADSLGIALRDPALWPTMTFVPQGTEIESLPVSEIDSAWALATVLDESMLPPHDSAGPLALGDSVGFRFDGDFNQDGIADRALVGVYRDTSGTEGSFLVILTRRDSTQWSPAFVATEPGEPRFSVLVTDPTGLIWAECRTCGRWRPVFWSEGHYELGPLAEAGQ
jgi:hypothetical protein